MTYKQFEAMAIYVLKQACACWHDISASVYVYCICIFINPFVCKMATFFACLSLRNYDCIFSSQKTYSVLGSFDIQGNNEIVCNMLSSVKRISILNCPCPSFVRTYKVCTWFFHKSENVHYYRKFSQCRTENLNWGIFQEVWPSSLRKTITGT